MTESYPGTLLIETASRREIQVFQMQGEQELNSVGFRAVAGKIAMDYAA
jgi:hypothetical protein